MPAQTASPVDTTLRDLDVQAASVASGLAVAASVSMAGDHQVPIVWVVVQDAQKAASLVVALARKNITARAVPDMVSLAQLLNASPVCRAWVADVHLTYPPLAVPVGFVLRGLTPTVPIFGFAEFDSVAGLMRLSQLGADQALRGSDDSAHQAHTIARILHATHNEALVVGCVKEDDLVTTSPSVVRLVSQARKLAHTQTSILVTGPTGAGKELVAGIICKSKTDRPLVSLNCAAMPEALIESELFGYAQGAFTGATKASAGLIQQADGGVLFLDEVGEMSLQTQAKLLRVLDTGELRALGGGSAKRVSFQLVCATHKNLELMCANGLFRQDLYYRIAGARLKLPALKERRSDIALLAQYFAAQSVCNATGLTVAFSGAGLKEMSNMAWAGNVRELKNFVRRCTSICGGHVITLDVVQQARLDWADQLGLTLVRDLLTREALLLALQVSGWRINDAAKLCGRNRTDIYRLINRYRLEQEL
jgi:two-component system response regulator GlrR